MPIRLQQTIIFFSIDLLSSLSVCSVVRKIVKMTDSVSRPKEVFSKAAGLSKSLKLKDCYYIWQRKATNPNSRESVCY